MPERRGTLKVLAVAAATFVALPFVSLFGGVATDATRKYVRANLKATRFSFQHPWYALGAIGLVGTLGYYACTEHRAIARYARDAGVRATTFVASLPYRVEAGIYRSRASELEEKLEEKEREASSLRTAAVTSAKRIGDLETDLSTARSPAGSSLERALHDAPSGSEARERDVISFPGYNLYIVKQGDTLSGISLAISGSERNYRMIAEDNGIEDPRKMAAGTLLRLRVGLCTRYNPHVYTRLPRLKHISLPGATRVSEAFPDSWRDVLALNKRLGLAYEDAYPFVNGERVIYYHE